MSFFSGFWLGLFSNDHKEMFFEHLLWASCQFVLSVSHQVYGLTIDKLYKLSAKDLCSACKYLLGSNDYW